MKSALQDRRCATRTKESVRKAHPTTPITVSFDCEAKSVFSTTTDAVGACDSTRRIVRCEESQRRVRQRPA